MTWVEVYFIVYYILISRLNVYRHISSENDFPTSENFSRGRKIWYKKKLEMKEISHEEKKDTFFMDIRSLSNGQSVVLVQVSIGHYPALAHVPSVERVYNLSGSCI